MLTLDATQELPRKYKKDEEVYVVDEQVYIQDDDGTDGQPTRRRLSICCMEYYPKEQMWKYRVKDKKVKDKNKWVDWYWENDLEFF